MTEFEISGLQNYTLENLIETCKLNHLHYPVSNETKLAFLAVVMKFIKEAKGE